MISGTMKGKVKMRKVFAGDQRNVVCAVMLLEVKNYSLGKLQTLLVECWLPAYASGKEKFMMEEGTQYFLVTFDNIVAPSANEYDGSRAAVGVVLVNLYRG